MEKHFCLPHGKIFVFIIAFLSLHNINAAGYQELPAILDGSMHLYDFSAVEPSVIPDSLTPVQVCYIARHGARYLTSENKISAVEKILNKAKSAGSLTRLGEECLQLMGEVRRSTSGRWGMLTEIGIEQERRLGQQMAQMYPGLFSSENSRIEAVSSYVPRVVETMDNFIVPVIEKNTGLFVSASSGRVYDYLTRFFAVNPAYNEWRHSGEWREVYDKFVNDSIPLGPAQRLTGTRSVLTQKEQKQLAYDLYKVLQGLRAMNLPAPSTKWMTEDEYRLCWQATNIEKYFQYSLSSLSAIPARGASDVLLALLNQMTLMEGYREKAAPQPASLYCIFGHAETLLPVFSLLGIEGTVALPLDYSNLQDEWNDAILTPLAANLEIIFCRSEKDILYSAMRLNGKNISPVGDGRKIIPVSELRHYWLVRLASLCNYSL